MRQSSPPSRRSNVISQDTAKRAVTDTGALSPPRPRSLHPDHALAESSSPTGTTTSSSPWSGAHPSSVGSPSDADPFLGSDFIAQTPDPAGMQQGQEDPLALRTSDDEQVTGVTAPNPSQSRQLRSLSPAKRRASAMDDDQMDVDKASPRPNPHPPPTPSSSSKHGSAQHTRNASVDRDRTNTTSAHPASEMEKLSDELSKSPPERPSIDDQVAQIMAQIQKEMEDGMAGYVVSQKWINRVLARSSERDTHAPYDKDVLEGEIGPVDNGDILLSQPAERLLDDDAEPFVPLKPDLTFHDLQIIPQEGFESIVEWYGLAQGQLPIKRYAHANNPDGFDKEIQWELYPPIFTLRRLRLEQKATFDEITNQDAKQKAPRIVASRNGLFQKFLRRAKEAAGVPTESKVKVWRVLTLEPAKVNGEPKAAVGTLLLSPPESREVSPAEQAATLPLIIKPDAFKRMAEGVEKVLIDAKDESSNEKYNGSSQLHMYGLAADQTLILEEQGSNGFLSDAGKKTAKAISNGGKKGGLLSTASSARSSPSLGPVTRGRNGAGKTLGSVGFTNLGNTCYMNSALQCIRATEELTCFFLAPKWKAELNTGNPLGYEGKMASTYASLLDSIFKTSSTSVTPNDFKRILSRCGPQFSGYGQQDSQEFMSFLVDALHEDLNRIHKKPYIENPDSDDARVRDADYIKELGRTYQTNYRKRNDSVICDLFNGFYKNTMVCPKCDKVSVTFDPYLLLTLQLPLEHSWQHTFYFWPRAGVRPVRVDVDMDKNGTIRQLKEYVASKINGCDPKRLVIAEIFREKFYRMMEDDQMSIGEANIRAADQMVIYELDDIPTNFPPSKKKGTSSMLSFGSSEDEDGPNADSAAADVLLVSVLQRVPSYAHDKSNKNWTLTLLPFFITLNRRELHNYQEIQRKILAGVASLTTRNFLDEHPPEEAELSPLDGNEERPVLTTEEDASFSIAGVQARSVDSEEGVVEVTMGKDEPAPKVVIDSKGDQPASNRVLKPGATISDALYNMFDLSYTTTGNTVVPTSYSMSGTGRYERLTSRLAKSSGRASAASSAAPTPASSVSSDADEVAESAQPGFVNDDASEEDELAFRKDIRASKKYRTYGKRGNAQRKQDRDSSDEPQSPISDFVMQSSQPIIHPGECIIVDWKYDVHQALFKGSDEDELLGSETMHKDTPLLVDDELAAKRKRRTERKKNGVSLDDCFNVTSQGEILTEENAWYCNRCKELRQAEKTLEIWTAPDILVIHLKRFSAARQFRDKIDILIDYPLEGLDLTDKVGESDGKEMVYDLFAVDNHYGGLGGGHYTAYAKNFMDGQWYEYNDSSVSKCNGKSVVTTAAYLLFYRRRSATYLGPESLQNTVNLVRHGEDGEESGMGDDGAESSRGVSPSGQGKGQRLGGSFLNGSSSDSAAAGAGRQPNRRAENYPAARAGIGPLTLAGDGQMPDGGSGYEADPEDEAVADLDAMDTEDLLPGPHQDAEQPPEYSAIKGAQYSEWSFAGIADPFPYVAGAGEDVDVDVDVDAEGEADSLLANDEGEGSDYDERMMEMRQDYEDEPLGFENAGHANSPVIYPSTELEPLEDLDRLVPLMHDGMEAERDRASEDDVYEIHLDSPPLSSRVAQLKKE